MITIRSDSSPRQIRALLILLVLVPLIPTVLMLRFMVETVRSEQLAAREHLAEVYARSFKAVVASLQHHLSTRTPATGAEAPAEIVAFCERQLSQDVAVQLVDQSGRELAGEGGAPGELIVDADVGEAFPTWKLRLFLRTPAIHGATEEQVRIYTWVALGAIALNLLIAGLASVALHWRIRVNQLENSALATLAHELKTPVASTKVLLETLKNEREPEPAQVRDYLDLMTQENERLGRLLEQFLALSRLERSRQALRTAPTPPAELAHAAAQLMDGQLHGAGCNFEIDAPADLPPVRADRDRVVVALVNLLDNALKYTGAEKQIRLRTRPLDGAVEFQVEDNGVGIPRRDQRKIFERFYQADQKLSRSREGCGLGLAIVREIARAHGGGVSVESEPGRGSIFRLRLPLAGSAA